MLEWLPYFAHVAAGHAACDFVLEIQVAVGHVAEVAGVPTRRTAVSNQVLKSWKRTLRGEAVLEHLCQPSEVAVAHHICVARYMPTHKTCERQRKRGVRSNKFMFALRDHRN